jgi:ATPase family associated with various cellular activities (AAA)
MVRTVRTALLYYLVRSVYFLATEWTRTRRRWEAALAHPEEKDPRVPTFIVVDEAHNLIPDEPRSHNERRLREQFRTIAAEGRKFGLFLILVSQRPDKLDSLVLSECTNRAVMKVGSEAVLKKTSDALGLADIAPKTLERCLEFDVGRALITGPWATEGPTFLYGAARRTREGGRNLQTEYWAKPEPIEAQEKTNGSIASKQVAKNIPTSAAIAAGGKTGSACACHPLAISMI